MTDKIDVAGLRALVAKATDEELTDDGRYFRETLSNLTECSHSEVGEYCNPHDGPLVEFLWNHRHALLDAAEAKAGLEGEVAALREQASRFASSENSMRDDLVLMGMARDSLRDLVIKAALCLSGFAGEGITIDGFEDPADVYMTLVKGIGLPDADDVDLRAALSERQQ